MHCETRETYVTALVRYVHLHGTSRFCLHCFECCSLLNKNLFLQSVEQWCLILSSVWMDVPWANVFCPSVDVHILRHAKQTRSLVPFLSSDGYLKKWFVVTLTRKLAQPLNFCVMSLNLHTWLVAKFNRVFSLFSYCKCYLVASTGILLGEGFCELSKKYS